MNVAFPVIGGVIYPVTYDPQTDGPYQPPVNIYANWQLAGGAASGPGPGNNPPTDHTIGFNTIDGGPIDNLDGTFDWDMNPLLASGRGYLTYDFAVNNPGLALGDEIEFTWLVTNFSANDFTVLSTPNLTGMTTAFSNVRVTGLTTMLVGFLATITDAGTYSSTFRIGLGITSNATNHLRISEPKAFIRTS